MQLFTNDREALFLERPNRFVVRARAGSEILQAHCPNPGRMMELLIPGRRLILQRRPASPRAHRLGYTLVAVRYRGSVIPLQSTRANALAEGLILPVLFPRLEGLEREVVAGDSRLDFRFRLPGDLQSMFLEVKSCTLVEEGTAMFPDAETARGLRHLDQLAQLARLGYRAGILFVVHNPQAERFVPDIHTDPAFSRRLLELREQIWIRAASIRTSPDGIAVLERLDVPFDVEAAAGCGADQGAYLLVSRVEQALSCPVGALGRLEFSPGYYVYVGSAMAGLSARLNRHLRKTKRLHWHIDYLLAQLPRANTRALPIRSRHRLECALAGEIAALTVERVASFGSSDCPCRSHLFRFAGDPLHSEGFLRVLLRYRHDLALRP